MQNDRYSGGRGGGGGATVVRVVLFETAGKSLKTLRSPSNHHH